MYIQSFVHDLQVLTNYKKIFLQNFIEGMSPWYNTSSDIVSISKTTTIPCATRRERVNYNSPWTTV